MPCCDFPSGPPFVKKIISEIRKVSEDAFIKRESLKTKAVSLRSVYKIEVGILKTQNLKNENSTKDCSQDEN